MKLSVLNFINSHQHNWQQLLQDEPYCIKINQSKDNKYFILKYDQTKSDFYLMMVQECRGLIIKHTDREYVPVCIPFFKFFNYGEKYASQIDWNSAQVQEKIDGSLIKYWFDDGKWHISTNNLIDAFDARVSLPYKDFQTYGDLVKYCLDKDYNDIEFDERYCYMFELVSPYTRVVIPYKDIKLYYLSRRSMITFEEDNSELYFKYKPKLYKINTLIDCINTADKLPSDKEGYVVCDKNFNRIKVKSPTYVAMHHIRCNNCTTKSILDLIRKNELDEYLTYFPEYTDLCKEIKHKYLKMLASLNICKTLIDEQVVKISERKEQALFIQKECKDNIDFAFVYLDKKYKSIDEFINNLTLEKLEQRIERF